MAKQHFTYNESLRRFTGGRLVPTAVFSILFDAALKGADVSILELAADTGEDVDSIFSALHDLRRAGALAIVSEAGERADSLAIEGLYLTVRTIPAPQRALPLDEPVAEDPAPNRFHGLEITDTDQYTPVYVSENRYHELERLATQPRGKNPKVDADRLVSLLEGTYLVAGEAGGGLLLERCTPAGHGSTEGAQVFTVGKAKWLIQGADKRLVAKIGTPEQLDSQRPPLDPIRAVRNLIGNLAEDGERVEVGDITFAAIHEARFGSRPDDMVIGFTLEAGEDAPQLYITRGGTLSIFGESEERPVEAPAAAVVAPKTMTEKLRAYLNEHEHLIGGIVRCTPDVFAAALSAACASGWVGRTDELDPCEHPEQCTEFRHVTLATTLERVGFMTAGALTFAVDGSLFEVPESAYNTPDVKESLTETPLVSTTGEPEGIAQEIDGPPAGSFRVVLQCMSELNPDWHVSMAINERAARYVFTHKTEGAFEVMVDEVDTTRPIGEVFEADLARWLNSTVQEAPDRDDRDVDPMSDPVLDGMEAGV